jgi:hypothetical protein
MGAQRGGRDGERGRPTDGLRVRPSQLVRSAKDVVDGRESQAEAQRPGRGDERPRLPPTRAYVPCWASRGLPRNLRRRRPTFSARRRTSDSLGASGTSMYIGGDLPEQNKHRPMRMPVSESAEPRQCFGDRLPKWSSLFPRYVLGATPDRVNCARRSLGADRLDPPPAKPPQRRFPGRMRPQDSGAIGVHPAHAGQTRYC